MVLDPLSLCARRRGPSEGLQHTPSAATQKKCKAIAEFPFPKAVKV